MNRSPYMEHISTIFMDVLCLTSLYFNHICFSGPGNIHFDHGRDVFFLLKPHEDMQRMVLRPRTWNAGAVIVPLPL